MASLSEMTQVTLIANGFYPQTYRWRGQLYRVLAVESVRMVGSEQHYRVLSHEGPFELALNRQTGAWRVHRSPNRLNRIWSRWQNGPRYPLPAWRRRLSRPAPSV